ncbi:hypothetical protein K4L44_04120 [Halosquirtibacter laminarini]|uniref:Uncharacterized protein n=1 Tax=Halosquirtibacter laminarini TaxID=3374600 RepID=A0AC61NHK6_9BACT|nr:hypothetical protein K4L44_04120 [Prolixibacteraceae bacterium]
MVVLLKGASYEYLVLMDAKRNEAKDRATNKGYQVLQQDSVAHVVKHAKLNMTGYVIFKPNEFHSKGRIKGVDTPLLLMMKENGKASMLTIANPDLHMPKWNHNMSVMPLDITHGYISGEVVSVTLDGIWRPIGYNYDLLSVKYDNQSTTLKIYTRDGKSIDLPLSKQ